jgi:hypothetical protein
MPTDSMTVQEFLDAATDLEDTHGEKLSAFLLSYMTAALDGRDRADAIDAARKEFGAD